LRRLRPSEKQNGANSPIVPSTRLLELILRFVETVDRKIFYRVGGMVSGDRDEPNGLVGRINLFGAEVF